MAVIKFILILLPLLLCGFCRGNDTHHESIGGWSEEIGYYQGIAIHPGTVYQKKSQYQFIEIFDSDYYGKILVLDGVVQLTERDADSYNEMMAHVAMMQHANPKRALVIGGGDGYVVSEVLKHASIVHVDHVDLDVHVIEACKAHFSWAKRAWDDPRVHLHIADGAAFVRLAANSSYDVIIQDSSDPWTTDEQGNQILLPSSLLFTPEHFQNIARILTPAGIFNFQAESFYFASDVEGIREWRKQAFQVGFQRARYGSLYISSYPTGQIGFLLCEKLPLECSSQDDVVGRFHAFHEKTSYYHPKLQQRYRSLLYAICCCMCTRNLIMLVPFV
jgi:spermidine synthase